jgi:hypothetical protein
MRAIVAALCTISLLAGRASTAPSPEVKSQLAPTGELRVAVLTSNPIAVVAIDPERRATVDFAPAHLNADGFLTVLVPPGSTARRMAARRRSGRRWCAAPARRSTDGRRDAWRPIP